MFEFSKMCKYVESLDPEVRAQVMAQKSPGIIAALSEITESGVDGVTIYLNFILASVAADGKLDESEFQLLRPMLEKLVGHEVTYDDAVGIFKAAGLDKSSDYRKAVDLMVDILGLISLDLKRDIIIVCLMICAIDGKISGKEKKWIKQLAR